MTAQALPGWFLWQPSKHSPSSLVSCSSLALQKNVATSSKVEGDAGCAMPAQDGLAFTKHA